MNFKYDRMCIVLKIYIFTFVMYVVKLCHPQNVYLLQ